MPFMHFVIRQGKKAKTKHIWFTTRHLESSHHKTEARIMFGLHWYSCMIQRDQMATIGDIICTTLHVTIRDPMGLKPIEQE
jgi:hypothetical protein